MEYIENGIIFVDQDGAVLSLSPAAIERLGTTLSGGSRTSLKNILRAVRRAGGSPVENPEQLLTAVFPLPRGPGEAMGTSTICSWESDFNWRAFAFEKRKDAAGLLLIGQATGRVARAQKLSSEIVQRLNRHNPETKMLLRELTGDLAKAMEAERHRIAREIHDDAGQALYLLAGWLREMHTLAKRTLSSEHEILLQQLDGAEQMAVEARAALRRAINGFFPPVLAELGLAAAVEWQIETFERATKIRCRADLSGAEGLPPEMALSVFRILQEALTNVARHAHASRVRVRLKRVRSALVLSVEDNGRGLSTKKARRNGEGFGLAGMERRAWEHGGRLEVRPRTPSGSIVRATLPLPKLAEPLSSQENGEGI